MQTSEEAASEVAYDSEEYQANFSASFEKWILIKESDDLKNYDVYYDDDGILNIMVSDNNDNSVAYGEKITNLNSSSLKAYEEVLAEDDNTDVDVIYRKAKYSKSYIKKIREVLEENIDELGLTYIGTSVKYNKAKIGVKDIAQKDKVLSFLNENIENFESDAVSIEEVDEAVSRADRSYPGRKVYWADYKIENNVMYYVDGCAGTSGFNAKDKSTGKYGIVTAAHVALQGKTIYNALDVKIGKATHRQLEKSMDAAFIPFGSSSFSPSMAIDGDTSNRITSYVKVADIVEGMPVASFGQATGKRITGTITDSSATTPIKFDSLNTTVTLTRLVITSFVSKDGDSGGPIVLNKASGTYSKNALVAIVTGGSTTATYSARAGYILATFGLSLYTG